MVSKRREILKMINGFKDLPVNNNVLIEIYDKMNDPNQNANTIAKFLEKDVGLSTKILTVVNSVHFAGRYGEIGSIAQAVARIGIKQSCQICLAVNAIGMIPGEFGFVDLKKFWSHSISVAMLTREVYEHKKTSENLDTGVVYLAGVVHDIGLMLLGKYFNEEYKLVQKKAEENELELHIAEQKVFGIDHAEIGSKILELWKFPENIVNVVKYHHQPDFADDKFLSLTQVLHLADFACSALGVGEPGGSLPASFSYGAWSDLDIDVEEIQKIIEEAEIEFEKANSFVEVGL